jgi:hypothetical protein
MLGTANEEAKVLNARRVFVEVAWFQAGVDNERY